MANYPPFQPTTNSSLKLTTVARLIFTPPPPSNSKTNDMTSPSNFHRLIPKPFRNSPFQIPHPPHSTLSPISHIESTTTTLLNTCKTLPHLKQTHAYIYRHYLHQNSFIITKLIRTLTNLTTNIHPYQIYVFSQVPRPNPFLYTAVIRGYILNGLFKNAVEVYCLMRRENVMPVSFTFSALFKGCTSVGNVVLGRALHGEVVKIGGYVADLHVGNSLIDMYVKCGEVWDGRKVFEEMPVRDFISGTSLIVAYAKVGEMGFARELFDELGVKDVVVWTSMINGYAQNARPREGLELFERMRECGVLPDEYTLVGVISACAQLGSLKYAGLIREIAERSGNGPERNVVVGSALVDMYAKCGRVDEAYEVFKVMRERNVYSYSSMIVGFAGHGRFDAAMQLFNEMERAGVRPNEVTFVGILTACSHAGMVEEGRRIFGSMEEKYGVVPNADHYACMTDLLGRSGHLEEAFGLAKSLKSHPHGGVWGALLGACSIHRNSDIAEIAASHLFELEPNSIGNYVVLANILATAGRWDRELQVRKLIREKDLKKNPGCSWVEGREGKMYEFFSGDLTHPRFGEMKQVLEEILNKLKLYGYEANVGSVSYDIDEDDKRQILITHSEKLALAFGLLTTDSDSTIRIMKNIRICEDCHNFMCGASKITGRELVVRDNMRFHIFHDGACSCGNFW